MKFQIFQISFIGMGTFSRKNLIILAPHNQGGWLMLSKIRLPNENTLDKYEYRSPISRLCQVGTRLLSCAGSFFLWPLLLAFRDAHPDSHLDLRWNRCRLPQPETHQSPIRIKARPIGGVRQSLALGTAVPQKILSARPLSIATADKSCGSPRAMDPVGANPLLAQPRGDSVAPVTGGERGGAYG